MSRLGTYYYDVERAATLLDERQSRLHNLIYPVLTEMGIDCKRIGIKSVYLSTVDIRITYGWSCRGLYDEDDITLPRRLFEALNPVEETRKYKAELNATAEAKERAAKVEKIAQLQKELLT